MTRGFRRPLAVSLLTLAGCTKTVDHPRLPQARATTCSPDRQAPQARALVERYCITCHSPTGDAGEEHDFTRPDVLRGQHRSISARLSAHSMPPRTSPQPTPPELTLLINWADCGGNASPQSPGESPSVLDWR